MWRRPLFNLAIWLYSRKWQSFCLLLLLLRLGPNAHPNRRVDYEYRFLDCGPASVYYQYRKEWHAPRHRHILLTLCAHSVNTFLALLSTLFVQSHPKVLIKDLDSKRSAEATAIFLSFICSEEKEPHAVLLCRGSETNRTNVRWQLFACSSHEPSMSLVFAPDPQYPGYLREAWRSLTF